MKKFKEIYFNSCIGLVSNALLDLPLIFLFSKIGLPPFIATIVATCIGYTISISIVLIYLKNNMKFNYNKTITTIKKLIVPSIIMIIPIIVAKHFITFEYTRLNSIISVLVFGLFGVIVYLTILYKNGSLDEVFGSENVNKILRKL